MTTLVTVELDTTKTAARARLEQAGFTVVRVSETRTPATISPRDPSMRADALTDMPPGLDRDEHRAYAAGYAQGCTRYVKRYGYPSVFGAGPVDKVALRKATIDHEWDRHPACHKAGMQALRRWQESTIAYSKIEIIKIKEA